MEQLSGASKGGAAGKGGAIIGAAAGAATGAAVYAGTAMLGRKVGKSFTNNSVKKKK